MVGRLSQVTGAELGEGQRQGSYGKVASCPFLLLLLLCHLEEGPHLVWAFQMLAAFLFLCFVFRFLWPGLKLTTPFFLFLPSTETTDVSHLLSILVFY